MKKLNFPEYEFRIESQDDKVMIFDQLRKKFVRLTAEEWVRQHMISYLIEARKIPGSLIRVEGGFKYDKMSKRTDILVYGRDGEPFLIIECKSPSVKIDEKVLFQAGIYGKSLRADYLGITNGINHFFCKMNYDKGTIEQLTDFPEY